MVHSERPSPTVPACWHCAAPVPTIRLDTETVLRTRAQADGGPYDVWNCACGVECGVLRGRDATWLLYPLEGLHEPGLLDRLAPRTSREAQDIAIAWWDRNRARVERFRRNAAAPRPRARPRPRRTAPPPRSPPPTSRRRAAGSAEERPRTPPAAPPAPTEIEARSAHELLGVTPGARADEIRSAYRRALKLCHPDRVANLDPEIQEVAHRKSKALRRAYEELLRRAPDE